MAKMGVFSLNCRGVRKIIILQLRTVRIMSSAMTLRDLPKKTLGRVVGFSSVDEELETRLREIGFAEGDELEIRHTGLFGRNPMSVRLNGAHIAMRRAEAEAVMVEEVIGHA